MLLDYLAHSSNSVNRESGKAGAKGPTQHRKQQSFRKHAYSNVLKILSPKNENFQIKNLISFTFHTKHRLWVLVRTASRRGGSNENPQSMILSRNKKNNLYPCKPQFYCIKGGLRGSKLYRHVFVMAVYEKT